MIWPALPAAAAAAYYSLAAVAALRWRRNAGSAGKGCAAPLSVLKPVHGRDPHFYRAIRSHATQDYPEFEILFGVSDANDPAVADIERLRCEFPGVRMEVIVAPTNAPNEKVGVLAALARRARYPLLLVNDSDIAVEPGYFRAVAAPLADPATGLVTCIYRAAGDSWPSRMEALGIATEFAPGVMVARLLGQAEFALGSTMALRADTLRAVGGFESLAEYIADDYQLGLRISRSGLRIRFAPVVVETHLGAGSWKEAWLHQLRWSRTIRVSRPGGYYGYAVTHATFWALAAIAAGHWGIGAAALAVRLLAGGLSAAVLGDRGAASRLWLVPLRDLAGFAVWAGGAFGNTVMWRGRRLLLRSDGRIQPAASLDAAHDRR